MSHDIGSLRISQQGRDQLIRLKRITGIKNWNVLCRWALAMSLADDSPPLVRNLVYDSNVEMSWATFAGANGPTYESLLKLRQRTDGGELSDLLRIHVHRGLGQLSGSLARGDAIEDLLHISVSADA